MSENEIRVLYVQPGKYPEERTIPNTLRALQELVGGDIECCRPWRDSVCVICNDSGKIDGLPPNRLYGHADDDEIAEIRRRWQPYLDLLPEYRSSCRAFHTAE